MGQDYLVAPGNPSGRPKRAANFADDLMAKLAEVIQVTERERGIKGDTGVANLLISWCGPSGQILTGGPVLAALARIAASLAAAAARSPPLIA